MDSRLWHSSPMHNFSGNPRVSVVSRWSPWWLNIQDFGPCSRFSPVCRPLDKSDFESIPQPLKPYVLHLRNYVPRSLQEAILETGRSAAQKMSTDYDLLEKLLADPTQLRALNENFTPTLISQRKMST